MNAANRRRPARIEETENQFIVTLDVSGFTRTELAVELVGRRVTIRGAERELRSRGEATFQVREVLEESFLLPEHVDAERLIVYYDRGLLEIHAPKRRAGARHRLPVVNKPHGLLWAEAEARLKPHDHVPVGLGLD